MSDMPPRGLEVRMACLDPLQQRGWARQRVQPPRVTGCPVLYARDHGLRNTSRVALICQPRRRSSAAAYVRQTVAILLCARAIAAERGAERQTQAAPPPITPAPD